MDDAAACGNAGKCGELLLCTVLCTLCTGLSKALKSRNVPFVRLLARFMGLQLPPASGLVIGEVGFYLTLCF